MKKTATMQVCKKNGFHAFVDIFLPGLRFTELAWLSVADSVSTRSNLCKYRMQVHPEEILFLQQLLCLSMRVMV